MMLQKEGYPEDGELVLCTVTNVQGHSVFVKLDEFGKSGMIHISEIAPGRIRNIRDYVKEGKVVVCKVLRINLERGHIDLSLRRVSDNQRRIKVSEVKQEQKAEKIIEQLAKDLKLEPKKTFAEVTGAILEHHHSLFAAFMEVVEGQSTFEKLGVPAQYATHLTEMITQRLKPQEVQIHGDLKLRSFEPDGVERVKKALGALQKDGADIKYIAAGQYRVTITDREYKSAEKKIDALVSPLVESFIKDGGLAEFARAQ